MKTIGTVKITIFKRSVDFHVVGNEPQEIIPFDFCRFPGKEFSDPEIEDLPEFLWEELRGNYSDRVQRVIRSLHESHLTPQEKNYVFGWAEVYANILYLNREKAIRASWNNGTPKNIQKLPRIFF